MKCKNDLNLDGGGGGGGGRGRVNTDSLFTYRITVTEDGGKQLFHIFSNIMHCTYQ